MGLAQLQRIMHDDSLAIIPSRLATPPSGRGIRPPVTTLSQELPFGDLEWEDFEKLCLRLARTESDVEHCQPYGTRGQIQSGIDVYARLREGKGYIVYQCKRVADFGPSEISDAVSKFLAGRWADRASTLVLCTSESLVARNRAEELEKQSTKLHPKGVRLLSWDAGELSLKLKNDPYIVYDFFGRPWVEQFCGEEAAVTTRSRLDASQITEYRRTLGEFYTHVFNINDPGIDTGLSADIGHLPVDRRFILPDIEQRQFVATSEASPAETAAQANEESFEWMPLSSFTKPSGSPESRPRNTFTTVAQRSPVDKWLGNSEKSIILGDAGSGKSTLLRFIVIDLFKEEPKLGRLAEKWGNYLPIWVPFPAWTEKIRHQPDCSLEDLLLGWLRGWNEERLWPLLKQALEDERLLLVVDGLDEWADEACAKRAVDRLQVFIAHRDLPAIVASRPHGFDKLGWQREGWQTAHLTGLTLDQQKEFAKVWFIHRASVLNQSSTQAELIGDREAENFIAELTENANIRELATVPLLLGIFIYFRFRNSQLPQNRFEAYERMVEQLISEHPSNRQRSAQIGDRPNALDADDLRAIFGLLAFELHRGQSSGILDKERARSLVEDYLEDEENGLGLEHSRALPLSRNFLDISQNTLGVLVERTPVDVGFFHRTFQEHLAAYWVSRMSPEKQLELVKDMSSDPQWSEVILALCYMTRHRPLEVKVLVEAIVDRCRTSPQANRYRISQLLAEIVFGNFNCPTPLARKLAHDTFEEIELGSWISHRAILLRHALSGLRTTALRDIVQSKVRGWLPCYSLLRTRLLNALSEWVPSQDLKNCFVRNLHDEELSNRRVAASGIVRIGSADASLAERLVRIAASSVNPDARVASIEALYKGWPAHPSLTGILENARCSVSPELRLTSVLGRIRLQIHTEDDLNELFRLCSQRKIGIYWREHIVTGLLSGWPLSLKVKSTCLDALLRNQPGIRGMGHEIAEAALIQGYPQDDEVADALIKRATRDGRFLSLDSIRERSYIVSNFKGHAKLSKAIDERLESGQANDELGDWILAHVSASDTAKSYLLNSLRSGHSVSWPAEILLETWGMTDSAVAAELTAIAEGPSARASQIADLIPTIIGDKSLAYQRLIQLLEDPSANRVSFIMTGLNKLNTKEHDSEVVSIVLRQLDIRNQTFRDDVIGHLILNYGSDSRVREIAVNELRRRSWTVEAIAFAYPNDESLTRDILDMAAPLPASLRLSIASDPTIVTNDPVFGSELVSNWDSDFDGEVKTEAAIRYYALKRSSQVDIESELAVLRKNLYALGPNFEATRQAAFAGLVALSRIDIIKQSKESEDFAFSTGSIFHRNLSMVKCILENWDVLKQQLGDEFWRELHIEKSDRLLSWSVLCPVVSDYESPRAELLEFLSARSERSSTIDVLQFLSKAPSHRGVFLEYLLEAISQNKRVPTDIESVSAAEMLGEHFEGDSDVYAQLETKTMTNPWFVPTTALIALCEGWPNSEAVQKAFDQFEAGGRADITIETWALLCTKCSSEVVLGSLLDLLKCYSDPNPWWDPHWARPVIRRLRTDLDLFRQLESRIRGSLTPSEKITIPKLLASARGTSSELTAWVTSEIERQLDSASSPEVGADLVVGEFRPVVDSLLELLSR